MNIAKHISHLIQFHECVIIPDFGAFISNYQPAHINVMRDTFSPPSKEVIFNSKIIKNDGILINYLVKSENITYEAAQNCIMNFVDRINKQLYKGEVVSYEELGNFRFDSEGNLHFNSEIKFDLIDSYGLDTFRYASNSQIGSLNDYNERPAIRAVKRKKDIVKIAASIGLLLTLSLFPFQDKNSQMQSSDLSPVSLFNSTQIPEVENTTEKTDAAEDRVESNKPYLLIGGSFKGPENAKTLEFQLNKDGHNTEIIHLENGYIRVVIDSYNTKEEALSAMKSFRSKHEGSNAWVSIR